MSTPPTISALIDTCNHLADALSERLGGVPADDPSAGLDLILIDRARALTAAAAAPLPTREDGADEPAGEPADCYYIFLRGNTIYWSSDAELTKAAHRRAQAVISKGWPEPGPLITTNLHPSKMGYAWQLQRATEVG